MNATEKRYAERLELLRLAGEIVSWKYEPRKITIAYRCTYTPDFEVVVRMHTPPLGRPFPIIEYHEVKGFMEDDAAVKLKVAANQNAEHNFYLVKWKNKAWNIKRVKTLYDMFAPKPKKESK
jgi:hypothetical protein